MATVCRRCLALQSMVLSRRISNFSRRLLCSKPPSFESRSEEFNGEVVEHFQDPKVQDLLKRITYSGLNLDKVFAARKEELEKPSYKLMTDEDLLKAETQIVEKAKKLLEMPVVRKQRKEINVVLTVDDNIKGHDTAKFVFTDISTSKTNRNRRIVVREPSGVLREATWTERDKMNFIYFPKPEQKYELPTMLQDEHLPVVYRQLRHKDVLDLVALQCEADSSDYIRVHHRTYDDIDKHKCFDVLRSTRYFGGLVFYLCQRKRIGRLFKDMLENNLTDGAIDIIKLLYFLHPSSKLEEASKEENKDGKELLLAYVRDHGPEDLLPYLLDNENGEEQSQHVS